jgi:integrase
MVRKDRAEARYRIWLAEHLGGEGNLPDKGTRPASAQAQAMTVAAKKTIVPGSLLYVATELLQHEEARTRKPGEPRSRGTLDPEVLADRKRQLQDFLSFMSQKHSQESLARMPLGNLSMSDVEEYNRQIVEKGYSVSQVAKRLQLVKALVDLAGRPENGLQRLAWNWDSREIFHGKPIKAKKLPTITQVKKLLLASDARGRAMIWLGIGLGFGQGDLAEIRVGQIDEESYDLRRGKTGIERYGKTPPLVWRAIQDYLRECPRSEGEPLFVSRKGMPLVHTGADSVQQWWHKLRKKVGESKENLSGFYILRHLGATEFGSRPQCSFGDMRRWLGHSINSHVADQYMKPLSPENRAVVEWVGKALLSGRADLRENST